MSRYHPSEILKSKTILLVDDETDLRELGLLRLKRYGLNCVGAKSGNEAFEVIKNQRIDFVISDVRMADGTGIDLLKSIKENNPDTPVLVFLSGFCDYTEDEIIGFGAEALYTKPIDYDTLIANVDQIVQKKAAA